jgi:hypothetical protein
VFFEECAEIASLGGSCEEGRFPSLCVKKAAHGIELTKIESENFHSLLSFGFGVGMNVTPCVSAQR